MPWEYCAGVSERDQQRALGFCGGVKTQANVVGGPVAVGVAEDGFEQSDGAGESCCAVGGREAVENAVAEGIEPGVHAGG